MIYSTDPSKAVVPVLVLLCVAFCFLLCFFSTRQFILSLARCFVLVFSVLLALRLPRLRKRELILVLFVRLFDLRVFGFVCFFFLLVSGKDCGLLLWYSLDFSLTFFVSFRLGVLFWSIINCLCRITLFFGNYNFCYATPSVNWVLMDYVTHQSIFRIDAHLIGFLSKIGSLECLK